MTLAEMAAAYEELLARKNELELETKRNNADIESFKQKMIEQMVDEDMPQFSSGGHSYSVVAKTRYSKKSDEALASEGLDFFQTLREEGLGDLIKETVNANTLNASMRNYVEEHNALSEGLAAVISTYDYNDISRATARKKKG